VFKPVSNPYESAIYANGIIESDQSSGAGITIFPEVPGLITQVLVAEGQQVTAGTPLLTLDDSVQRGVAEQLRSQSQGALELLKELKALPRKQTLAIAEAQVELARTALKAAREQYEKRRSAFDLNAKAVSRDVLDTARDAASQAQAGLDVAQRQLDLTRAGAWTYDVNNQARQYDALRKAWEGADALLRKYQVKAQVDGVVLAINAGVGSYVSPLGAYDAYTQGQNPLIVMGTPQEHLAVRCYVDEILIARLPAAAHIVAQMSIQGTDLKVPLEFVRVQPYVSPKIELSNQRQEKVDLRVLPVLFRFEKKDAPVYPGMLVDVFIGQK
jgi:HlyD family secretion protein